MQKNKFHFLVVVQNYKTPACHRVPTEGIHGVHMCTFRKVLFASKSWHSASQPINTGTQLDKKVFIRSILQPLNKNIPAKCSEHIYQVPTALRKQQALEAFTLVDRTNINIPYVYA